MERLDYFQPLSNESLMSQVGTVVGGKRESVRLRGYLFFKRAFDIVASFSGLIVLMPLFVVVAIAIRAESKGKVIFKQKRMGKDGKPFTFYKFRSMCDDAEKKHESLLVFNEMGGPLFKIANDPRVTRVGKFIRETSIDELPQLYNILRGEMTFIGPRPLPIYEATLLDEYQMRRHNVKGGLTCYWQVNGRSEITNSAERLNLDLRYIDELSLKVDTIIFFKTFKVVFSRKGAV
ncbi:MAG: sugar transferase [Clostridiales bacterium]|jgi:lipopolysaccharide/colanic/teichoic acid biosynthesis glycosyltransferase|nr:sugar transferase [Clostridiales bacterium]